MLALFLLRGRRLFVTSRILWAGLPAQWCMGAGRRLPRSLIIRSQAELQNGARIWAAGIRRVASWRWPNHSSEVCHTNSSKIILLVYFCRGLGLDRIFLKFLKLYSDPHSLVLVLNCTQSQEVSSEMMWEMYTVSKNDGTIDAPPPPLPSPPRALPYLKALMGGAWAH